MKQPYCIMVRASAMFSDSLKVLAVLSEPWCSVFSWPAGARWINIPNSLCAWIIYPQDHLLVLPPVPFCSFSAGEHTARKAFILLKRQRPNRSFLTSLWHTELGHLGKSVSGSCMSWLLRYRLIKIYFTQLRPFRAGCLETTKLHPLVEMGCLWVWTLRLRRTAGVWDGRSLMRSGSATPWEDTSILFASRKTVN